MSIQGLVAAACLLTGSGLMLLAGVGLLRMPDLYIRMQAAAKASSLGVGLMVAGAGLHLASLAASIRAVSIVVFLFLTVPVAAHLIARAAYYVGVPLWERTHPNDLGVRAIREDRSGSRAVSEQSQEQQVNDPGAGG